MKVSLYNLNMNIQKNISFLGASGSMEKELIHQMFCRSVFKYDVKYTSFIGDGDAKVHKYLLESPPYSDVKIKKIEDVNHFAKRMLARINKIKQDNKTTILSDGKKLHGKGRMTDGQAIKFKIYFGKAIRENKSNLDNMYKRSWAIFKHRYSTNDEPMHEWGDPKWCQYLQAVANGQTFDHSKSSIPHPCLDMIKPAFDELCSRESLERVVGGGSQNANEAFRSLLWTMVPKHRYCSSTILRIALGLSAMVFNDGYISLNKLFTSIFGAMGHYTTECFGRLDEIRKYTGLKEKNRRRKLPKTKTTTITGSSGSDDDDVLYMINDDYVGDYSDDDLITDESAESEDDESEENDAYEAGGDD
jgi:hypothetical protein